MEYNVCFFSLFFYTVW